MQTQSNHTASSKPHTGPTGQDLDETLGHLGRAHIALSGLRTLVHTHSTRHTLVVNEDAVQYLLEKRDELIAAIDAGLTSYAHAVDPSGTLAELVTDAIGAQPAPELVPIDDDAVFGIRYVRRSANGNTIEVKRYS